MGDAASSQTHRDCSTWAARLDGLTERPRPVLFLREAGDTVLATWAGVEQKRLWNTHELQLTNGRADGALRPHVTMLVYGPARSQRATSERY